MYTIQAYRVLRVISPTLQKREFMLFLCSFTAKIRILRIMEDLKIIVGKNLSSLRKAKKLTQIELAEKFNYSDKAVSKWEQGATLPDLETLKQLCDFYGVTIDYLTHEENIATPVVDDRRERTILINRIITSCLIGLIIWMIATFMFVYPMIFSEQQKPYWVIFVWAVSVTAFFTIVLNFIFFKRNRIVSFAAWTVFSWTLIAAIFLHFLFFSDPNRNIWPIFLIGIPLQMIFVLWFIIRKKTK